MGKEGSQINNSQLLSRRGGGGGCRGQVYLLKLECTLSLPDFYLENKLCYTMV